MEASNEARRSSFPSSPNRSLNTKSFLGDSMYGSVPFDIFRGLLFGFNFSSSGQALNFSRP